MIADTLQNRRLYEAVHPAFARAFDFLEKAMAEELPVGRYELDGDAVYAMVQAYETKPHAAGKAEGHRRYIDIQFVAAGTEQIGVADVAACTPQTEYDAEKDVQFFETTAPGSLLTLTAGAFAVFFPQDIHTPGLAENDASAPVKKVVVKIAV